MSMRTVPEIKDCVFLMSVKGLLEADAYEEMFSKNSLPVAKELCGNYGTIDYLTSDKKAQDINLYVRAEDLERSRLLLDRFETEQVDYRMSFTDDHRSSPGGRLLFALLICVIVVFPIVLGIATLVRKVIQGF